MAYIFGIMGSPRKDGNSDRLIKAFMEGSKEEGVKTYTVSIGDLNIGPCQGCRFCEVNGYCRLSDDMERILGFLRRADAVILSSPVFFYGFPAQTKALVDRVQVLWARQYVMKLQDPKKSGRTGVLLSVGATKGLSLFQGIELTFKYFMDSIGGKMGQTLYFRNIEKPKDIELREHAINDAYELGRLVAMRIKGRKRVLFVCHHNSRRSQIAEALLQFYGGESFDVESAGDAPSMKIDPEVIKVLEEKGIDIAYRTPKGFEEVDMERGFDVLVQMGCESSCPFIKADRIENWGIEDPAGKGITLLRKITEEIDSRVRLLRDSLSH